MKKIPTVFEHDVATHLVVPRLVKGCGWVMRGFGHPTRKFDGTACMLRDGVLYARREVREGAPMPEGFMEVGRDNGKSQGWVPVGKGPEHAAHREACERLRDAARLAGVSLSDSALNGTYELVGPKVQGNPECYPYHVLVPHGAIAVEPPEPAGSVEEWFWELRAWFQGDGSTVEGIVWHRVMADGEEPEMAKLKAKDFGLRRRPAPPPAGDPLPEAIDAPTEEPV